MSVPVAVVGLGPIGRQHLAAYAACREAEIVAVCDLLADKAEECASIYGCRAYTNLSALLSAEPVRAISVCTAGAQNGSHHFGPVMQCLAAGRHVLCEKPLSNQVSEARAMVQRARSLGLALGCDLNHRFTPVADVARRWVAEGRIGTLLLCNMTLWIDNPADLSPWYHVRALHPHSVDVMRTFMGPVSRVQAFMAKAPSASTSDGLRVTWSCVQANMLFASGAVGHLTGSYDVNMRQGFERCELLGDRGRIVIDDCFDRVTLYPRDSGECTVVPNGFFGGVVGFEQTIERRIARWVEQIGAGADPAEIDASGADGLAVQEIIEAAIESWEHGTVVDVAG